MHKGKVKWFDPIKGYGFIEPQDKSKDIFLHISAVTQAGLKSLDNDQKISFQIETKNGKTSAVDIKLL